MIKIMMCQSVRESEISKYKQGYYGEMKFDGVRCIYNKGKFWSSNRKEYGLSRDLSYKLPELKHTEIDAVLDGELISENGDFNDVGGRVHMEDKLGIRISAKKNPVIYKVFDILEVAGKDVSQLPLNKRKELLKSITFDNPRLQITEYTENIEELWEQVKKDESEGIIIKKADGVYEKGRRSYNWLKCKYWKEDIVLVKSYTENPKGIRLEIEGTTQGIQCAGGQSNAVRDVIDDVGSVRIEIQYLSKNEENGRFRFPSYKRMVGDIE